MKFIRKIVVNILLLTVNVLLIGLDSVKKITLPKLHRKGNILSVIFSFLVEVTDEVLVFEKAILNKSVLLRHTFVKRGLVIAAAFFFLISSFEWVVTNKQPVVSNEVYATRIKEKIKGLEIANEQNAYIPFVTKQATLTRETGGKQEESYDHSYFIPYKQYLVNCVLLI